MKLLRLLAFGLISAVAVASCVKQEFDTPPDTSKVDPLLPVNRTIRNLADSALNLLDGGTQKLGDDIIYGIVVADDHSGNFYKQIIIQDTSGGGILIMLDETTLYGDFPIGRKVYVKLKGLLLTNYKGLPQVVYDLDTVAGRTNGIPASLIKNYVIKGSFPNKIEPKLLTIAEIYTSPTRYLNTLVKIENMQFDAPHANVLYSSPDKSTTRLISDCPYTQTLGMYNSSFSNFQSAKTPNGKGTITGILSTYNNPQFLIRDTTDVQFTQPRDCP